MPTRRIAVATSQAAVEIAAFEPPSALVRIEVTQTVALGRFEKLEGIHQARARHVRLDQQRAAVGLTLFSGALHPIVEAI